MEKPSIENRFAYRGIEMETKCVFGYRGRSYIIFLDFNFS